MIPEPLVVSLPSSTLRAYLCLCWFCPRFLHSTRYHVSWNVSLTILEPPESLSDWDEEER
jgi:hypothetical protein